MNCNEFCRLLNECEIADLPPAEAAGLKAHRAQCAECAAQWRVSLRLATFRTDVPPMPAALEARVRQLEDARDADAGRRHLRRPLIIGSLFIVGATAAMFAGVSWRGGSAELAD